MGDWLHDKSIPWKAGQIREHFRASPASRNGASTRTGYVVCVSDAGRWAWDFWAKNPLEAPQVIYKSSVCRLQAPAATEAHNHCFQQVQEDMCKACSVCKEWNFVSRGTELSVGRFLIEYFTPLTLGDQHQGARSDEDVIEVWATAKSATIIKVRR